MRGKSLIEALEGQCIDALNQGGHALADLGGHEVVEACVPAHQSIELDGRVQPQPAIDAGLAAGVVQAARQQAARADNAGLPLVHPMQQSGCGRRHLRGASAGAPVQAREPGAAILRHEARLAREGSADSRSRRAVGSVRPCKE